MSDLNKSVDIGVQVHGASDVDNLVNKLNNLNKALDRTREYYTSISSDSKRAIISEVINEEDLKRQISEIKEVTNEIKKLTSINKPDGLFSTQDIDRLETLNKRFDELQNKIKASGGLINVDNKVSTPSDLGVDINALLPQASSELNDASETTEELRNNSELLSKVLPLVAKQLGLSSSEASQLATAFGATAEAASTFAIAIGGVVTAIGAAVAIFKYFYDATEEVLGVLKNVGIQIANFVGNLAVGTLQAFADGLNMMVEGFENLTSFVKDAVDQLKEFADLGADVQSSYFRIYKYLGADVGSGFIDYLENLSEALNVDSTKFSKNIQSILSVTTQLGVGAEDVTKYSKALLNLSQDIATFSGTNVEDIISQLENAINLGVLNSRSAIAKSLDLRKEDIEKFKSLSSEVDKINFLMMKSSSIQGMYAKYMETSAGKVKQLQGALANFNNTVGKVALEIYGLIAPVLTKIINLATYAINVIAKFFGIDLSSKNGGFSSPDYSGMADEAGKYTDSLEDAKKATDDLGDSSKKNERKVASFDDVIQINESKSSSSDSFKGTADELEKIKDFDIGGFADQWNDMIDDLDVPDFSFDSLKKKLQELLDKFKEWAKAIPWDVIRKKAADFGKQLASLLNVVVDDKDAFKLLGSTIGQGFNTALEALNSFAKEFHFEGFGQDIALTLNNFFDALDENLAAETIYNWIDGAVKMGIGFFKERSLTNAATSIAEIFAGIFNRLSSPDFTLDINEFINNFADDLSGAFDSMSKTFDDNDTVNNIITVVKNIMLKVGEKLPEVISSFSTFFVHVLDTVGGSIAGGIDSFLTGLFTPDENGKTGGDKLLDSIFNIINSVFENIGKIGEALNSHSDEVVGLINEFIDSLFKGADTYGEEVSPLFDFINKLMEDVDWEKLGDAIKKFLETSGIAKTVSDWVATKITWLLNELKTKAPIAAQAFSDFVSSPEISSIITNAFSTLIGFVLRAIVESIGTFFATVLGTIVGTLAGLIAGVILIIVNFFTECGQTIVDMWNNDIKPSLDIIGDGLKSLWDALSKLFNDIGDGISNWWDNTIKPIIDGISKGWSDFWDGVYKTAADLWDKIKIIFDGLAKGIKDIGDAISNFNPGEALNSLGGKISSAFSFDFKVPKMAIGGIVTSSTLANIGEDGTEAVLPLQKNTEWMDVLANKIASRSGSGSSGSRNMTVNMPNKTVYTRSELLEMGGIIQQALSAYGVTVSFS